MTSSIWPKASPKRVDRSISAHSVMGVVMGALLYIVCLSGALAVFENYVEWWEEPGAPRVAAMSPEAVQAAAEAALAADPEETTHLYVYPPTPEWPRAVAATDQVEIVVDAEGRFVSERHAPWTHFLLDLHYYLHLPETIGFTLVGALGAVMVALTISGFLAHPRIFREAFSMRRDGSPRVAEIDLHNRLSVWTAPFHIAVSLTGAMIGLYLLATVVVSQIGFGGDMDAVSAAVYGEEPAENPAPAPPPNIAAAMAHMADAFPETTPILAMVHEPETAGQHLQVLAEHPGRLIYGEYYNFDAEGRFRGTVGLADGTLGQQFAMSTYVVHFGSFGGLAIEIAYGLLGLALCVIVASGLNIYFIKRREKARAAPRLEAAWAAVVWGTPAALAATLLGSVTGILGEALLAPAFWILLVAMIGAAVAQAHGRLAPDILRGLAGLCLLGSALAHAAIHGARSIGSIETAAVEVVLALAGVALSASAAFAVLRPRRRRAADVAAQRPAE